MNRRIAIRAIILDEDGKLFCVKLKAYGGKGPRDFWCLPGGGLDLGEGLQPALKREMLEETAVAAEVGQLLYIQQFSFEGEEQLEFFFHVTNTDDYKNLDISVATHAEEEIAEFGFVDPKTTHILPEFLTTVDVADQIKNPQPPKVFNYL